MDEVIEPLAVKEEIIRAATVAHDFARRNDGTVIRQVERLVAGLLGGYGGMVIRSLLISLRNKDA